MRNTAFLQPKFATFRVLPPVRLLASMIIVVTGAVWVQSPLKGAAAPATAATQPAAERRFRFRTIDQQDQPVAFVKLRVISDHPNFPLFPAGIVPVSTSADVDVNGIASIEFPPVPANIIATINGYAPVFIRGADLT